MIELSIQKMVLYTASHFLYILFEILREIKHFRVRLHWIIPILYNLFTIIN